jgi:3-oxoadipate enol-lactonase/4-carboxymuconolactone decarboxylase
MPLTQINGHTCHYRVDGPDDAPVLMLSHSLGLAYGMWDAQVIDCQRFFRVIRYDLRGHGASSATPGDYTIEQLALDALALADHLGAPRFAFCGLSIGGMVGQWLGVHARERLTHLVIANSSPRPDAEAFEARRRAVLESGLAPIEPVAMGRFFSPAFLAAHSAAVTWASRTLLGTDRVGYAGCCAAIRDTDMRAQLHEIRTPTLVICGTLDIPMPWAGHSEIMAGAIAGSVAVQLPAGHISNLERPRSFSAALHAFLIPPADDTRSAGFAVRRSVLGDPHVDRAVASTTPFTAAFQELVTRYAWGTIWTRPGLDPRTRRLLVLAMTAAEGRWEEFRLHVRSGLAGELEPCDLEEVLLQVAIYAGVPAANTGFHIASEELGPAGGTGPR